MYIEAEDQKYGHMTTELSYSLRSNSLVLTFSKDFLLSFHWNQEKEIMIDIEVDPSGRLREVLDRIFKTCRHE